MTKAIKKMTFWPCWSLYSWYKVLSHKQYFPSAPFPLLPPSLCLCGGWSLRRWPVWRAMERHIRAILHVKCTVKEGRKGLWLIIIFTSYCGNNFLVPVWESIASDPGPSWGNSLPSSSQQESTGHFPDLRPRSLDLLSRYCSLRASDALSRGWGLRGSLQTPSSLLVHPAEPATRRRVQSNGADSAQSFSVLLLISF